ncbi:hypothetical protein GGR56DRAFT_673648 [Xylariaceae sp. FL0804]|nr:hypothetical protein GGR56DRAFT_673648 [Xylariaceae sp. FL0804]
MAYQPRDQSSRSFIPLVDQTPESIRKASTPPPRPSTGTLVPLVSTGERRSSIMNMLQDILQKSESAGSSAKSSRSSSGARRGAGSKKISVYRLQNGCAACSEDATPHVCVNEQSNTSSGQELVG